MKNSNRNFSAVLPSAIKARILPVLIMAILLVSQAYAQTFSKVATYKVQQRSIITFTVAREANVRFYNIEAADDTAAFESIARVKSLGNSVMPRDYHLDITGNEHKYYRITAEQMNWQTERSPIIMAGESPANRPNTEYTAPASQIATVKNIQ